MPPSHILILGAGPCGLATALSLHLHASIPVSDIKILELRPSPSTIGGAVGLPPNALRYLDALGVLPALREKSAEVGGIEIVSLRTGGKLGELSFRGPRGEGVGGYMGLRIKRGDLANVLLERWRSLGGEVVFGFRSVTFEELGGDEGVKVVCDDGREEVGNFLIGCDGIHSWARTVIVQPERRPVYSGMMTCYGIVSVEDNLELKGALESLSFQSTGLFASRRGSLLVSYCKPGQSEVYLGAVMETKEVDSREGWKTKGEDQEAVRRTLLDRFGGDIGTRNDLKVLIEAVKDWYLYPVHKLPPKGQWSKGKVLLLGDAAHAVSVSVPDISNDLLISEDATTRRKCWPGNRRFDALRQHSY
jgi:salicylate hydroxylase